MTIKYCLDEDFVRSLYERAMSDPRTIPQSLLEISAAIKFVRAEREDAISRFDGTIAHLEEMAAALRARTSRADTHRQSVVTQTSHRRGLFVGSKNHRTFTIVVELSKAKGSAKIAELVAEMDKQGLFENVRGNRTQNASDVLHQLKKAGHLNSDGRGNWYPTSGRMAE